MLLSPGKIGNREFESDYHQRPHFLAIQLFQRKYLGYTLNAVSLSLHIFEGRVGLLHYSRSCYSFSLEDFDLLWLFLIWKQTLLGTSWSCFQKQPTQIFEFNKIEGKYSYISNSIFTMMGAPEKEVILRCFFQNKVNCLCAKFEVPPIPPTGFLPIKATSFTNIRWAYFSLNICTVVHQSELELLDLDQNWAKTRPLLFPTFEISYFNG